MRVYVADAHVHKQRLVSAIKMVTRLEECATKKQHSVVRFLWEEGLDAKIFIKKCFPFIVGSVCHIKRFTTGSRNSLEGVQKSQMMPDQVQKWLSQQSKYFYAADSDALVKQWDKCINVGGGYVEK
jgi:hypothetical protein